MSHPSLLHPCPYGRPLLSRTSAGDAQTQFCLSLCGVSGSWCAQGLFEPSELLWEKWGLILNVNSPLLLSCWGFSYALGCGVSSQLLQRLPSYWGFSTRYVPRFFVSSQQRFGAMDIKALGTSQLLGLGQTVL